MKKVIAAKKGGPEVLAVIETDIPEPAPGEVRVKVLAAGAAFGDLLWMSGVVPGSPKPPYTPGYDFVGEVDQLGDGVTRFEVGQRVAALVQTGAYAEYSCWPVEKLAPVTAELEPEQIVTLTLNYITAYNFIHRVGKLQAGQTVLVHGASGGFGTAMVDLSKYYGLRVFGTASKAKHDLVEKLGGIPIDYQDEDFVQVVNAQGGADLVIDHIGGKHLKRSFAVLKPGGTLVSISSYAAALGQAGVVETLGGLIRLSLWNLLPNQRQALLYDVTPYYKENPADYAADISVLVGLLAEGVINPVVDSTFSLEQVPEALTYLRSGKARGKVVVKI